MCRNGALMRKTKIICTIGPACADEKIITSMLHSGMNAGRFVYSNDAADDIANHIVLLRTISNKLTLPVAIILDVPASASQRESQSSYLAGQNTDALLFAIRQDVDYIICQDVCCKQDLMEIDDFLEAHHANQIELLANIVSQSGIDNIDGICDACSGILMDRDKASTLIAPEQLPALQKLLITRCRMLGKQVISATCMLKSMTRHLSPTSAEISDVANAIYDGASAVMLSDETAAGKHTVASVDFMARIVLQTEENIHYRKRFFSSKFLSRTIVDAISHAVCSIAVDVNAKAIAVCTRSGTTAAMVSRFRSPVVVVAVTADKKVYQKLSLLWGVIPVLCANASADTSLLANAKALTAKMLSLRKGDTVVLSDSMTNTVNNTANLIKIEAIS